MKKTVFLISFCLALFACNNGNNFVVEGEIKDAKDKTLYLERAGLIKTVVLDSVKLKENGKFRFRSKRPDYPDLYRLKLENKQIVFAVDSTETITINSQFQNFAMDYTVEGSPASLQIQQLRKSLNAIQQSVDENTSGLSAEERQKRLEKIRTDIEIHKDSARSIILNGGGKSMAAYFALHQQVSGSMLFSPYVKEDQPYYNAVATAFHVAMPDYERSKNLYSNAMDAIKLEREQKDRQAWNAYMEAEGKGYIDIDLPDKDGLERKLSSLEGKVVLVDFSSFDMKGSVDYVFALRDLYDKYSKRGFEIYQVGLDQNKILWESSVENLPWVCVRDKNGPNTIAVGMYNVQTIPTAFLLDRNGNIVSRLASIDQADKIIRENL